ncbi:hypothetical protein WMY93_034339 [Mugilogobius chulae]|uniref:Uncharacterized protein n=1 Tax=Mugilogobius chulae TaxID=88201 RepID=A0AAW0MJ41_9GOBI
MSNRGDKRPLKPKMLVLADNANSAATGGNPFADNDHDYSVCSVPLPATEELMNEFPALPLSPTQSPAPKKAMHSQAENVDVVATLSKLINKRMDDLALQLVGVKKTVDFVCEEIKDVKGRVKTLEMRVTKEVDRLDTNQQRIADLERYSRRWNLRLLGVKETEKEDALHRVGAKLPNANKSRTIIIQFISRVTRDGLWKAAKTSSFLKENHLKFAEDLSKEDRERRSKLWPLIEKARNEGKKAYYVGCRGFINGTEIPLPSE